MSENVDSDFNTDNLNQFFYTQDKQIKKMDDIFILSKITEMYPDFNQNSSDNIIKLVIQVVLSDSKLILDISKKYDIDTLELFKIIYRNYEYVFNKCFISKVQKTIKNKKYARRAARCRTRKV